MKQTDNQAKRILEFLQRRPMQAHLATEIAEGTGLRHGSFYAGLAALEREGAVASDWQAMTEPKRRMYWALERM